MVDKTHLLMGLTINQLITGYLLDVHHPEKGVIVYRDRIILNMYDYSWLVVWNILYIWGNPSH